MSNDTPSFDCAHTPLIKGVTLLEASAGTGKTYALARIVLRLVAEKGVEIGRILTVTFTTAATDELRSRIRSLLAEALARIMEDEEIRDDETIESLRLKRDQRDSIIRRLRLAVTSFDEAVICTIHGFCNRALMENAFQTNSLFDAELHRDSKSLAVEAMEEFWRERIAVAHPVVAAAASTEKLKLETQAVFFDRLPKTEEYHLGFKLEVEDVESKLIERFDDLCQAWPGARAEYVEYVGKCVKSGTRLQKYCQLHAGILDSALGEGAVSPASLKVLEEIREGNLKLKNDYLDHPKPVVAVLAERFCETMGLFGRAIRVSCVDYATQKVMQWKERRGILSFDDLLGFTAKAVAAGDDSGAALRKSLGERFDAALIDEFQDTDPVQFRIFKDLFGLGSSHWLFLIGDPKQSIYRFRGADLEAYFKFARDTGATKFSLNVNHRTVAPLVNAVNQVFTGSDNPFLHTDLTFTPVSPRGGEDDVKKTFAWGRDTASALEIRELNWNRDKEPGNSDARRCILRNMGNEICRLLDEGRIGGNPVRPGDIAILVRANWEAREVWRDLRRRGLPAIVHSDVSLFEGEEAKELLWVLEAIIHYRNERSIKRALATGLMGKVVGDFEEWQDNPGEWDDWVDRFRKYLDMWRKRGVYVALRELFTDADVLQLNLRRNDGERRITNFLHLSEVLHQASSENPLSPSSLCHWLRGHIADENPSSDEYQLRLESQSESVRILTTHKSKGLEFPIVFLPGLFFNFGGRNGDFRYHDKDGKLVINLGDYADDEAKEMGRLEEEREDARVFYVAVTRAVSSCYIYHAPVAVRDGQKVPSLTRIIRSWDIDDDGDADESGGIQANVAGWLANMDASQAAYISFDADETESASIPVESLVGEASTLEHARWEEGRSLPGCRLVTSFSGLVKDVGFEGRDLDAGTPDEDFSGAVKQQSLPLIFEFPAGAHAGNFMHDLFENAKFTDSSEWDKLIRDRLARHMFEEKWAAPIRSMLEEVVKTELEPGLRLAEVPDEDRLNELSFNYTIDRARLVKCASRLPENDLLRLYLEGVKSVEPGQHAINSEKFMNGSIDLLFRSNGKYYILDWKSNNLNGGMPGGFAPEHLKSEMLANKYVLQYHVYVVAVHRYLKQRIPEYNYDTHFGGVFYLFVRGMKQGEKEGVFTARPPLAVVETFDNFLKGKS